MLFGVTMTGRSAAYLYIAMLSAGILFTGCNERTNRNYFSNISETEVQDGLQVFEYKTSAGGYGMKCYGGACKLDYSQWRRPKWPYESQEAEAVRMEWLKTWLGEKGYANADYKILSRERIYDTAVTGQRFDVRYEVAVRADSRGIATTQEETSSGGILGIFE